MNEIYEIHIDSYFRDENKFTVELINRDTDRVYNLNGTFDSRDEALQAVADCIKMINA